MRPSTNAHGETFAGVFCAGVYQGLVTAVTRSELHLNLLRMLLPAVCDSGERAYAVIVPNNEDSCPKHFRSGRDVALPTLELFTN